jgi:hypothetical protein
VTALPSRQHEENDMTRRKSVRKAQRAATIKAPVKAAGHVESQSISRANSKQVKVIGMLSQPTGSTIPAIMKATGWQQHSVRGFFASVVRKKLGLTLESDKADGRDRAYRIVRAKPSKGKPKGTQSNSPIG